MKPASYWNKRMEILEQSRYDGNVQSYHEIETIYRKQMAEMQKEINAWYARFAKNNEINLADARKLLDAKELEELKWNVEDYIKYGTENALDPKWIKQLENASARYHISRLEALQLQIQQRAESVMAAEQDIVDQRVREVYSENYYHTAFEIQRGIGVGWDLERLDERRIDNVISKPWAVDGKNFSERIWEQRDKLVNTLHQELTQSIIRGEDPERAVKTLAERMSVSQSNARRLIMTESAAMASAAQKECYKELDVEQYKIVATLDDLTCDVCAGLDGQVFKMSEYNVGTTAPPFHPNCRTVTVPYFADDADSKRAARGSDGKTYLVPADTKYNEWKKAFVDGEEKPFKNEPFILENKQKQSIEINNQENSLTFDEKLNNIKEEFNEKYLPYVELNNTIDTLTNNLEQLNLEKDKQTQLARTLQNDINRYKKLDGVNFDSEIDSNLVKLKDLENKINNYESINNRYYAAPKIRTDEWRNWKEWKANLDASDPDWQTKYSDYIVEKSNIERNLKQLQDDKKWFDSKDIKTLENDFNKASQNLLNIKIEIPRTRSLIAQKQLELEKVIKTTAQEIEPIIRKAGKITFEEVQNDPKFKERYIQSDVLANELQDLNDRIEAYANKYGWDNEYIEKLTEKYFELQEKKNQMDDNLYYDIAKIVKSKLSEVRKMGVDVVDVDKHFINKDSKIHDSVLKACSNYPNDWVLKSNDYGELNSQYLDRGHYDDANKIIAISGDGGKESFKTSVHEWAHRFEKAVPIINELESVFYERRTNGEPLEKLKDLFPNSTYEDWEVTRKDNFIDAYMGKDYGGDAYELVSMGFEHAYCNPLYLNSDKDFANFIYGILTLI